ncbi:MAG: hypothetical protein WB774_20415, partial [Xanthobacteraceae bacterium]
MLAALHQKKRRGVLLADHAAIHADIHHAGVGILGDDRGEGVNVTAALKIMHLRHREFGLVDRRRGRSP